MDPNYADNAWKLLKNAINEIHRQNASGLSFEELYRNAYNMVLHKYGDILYKGLQQVVDEHLKGVAQKVALANDDNFLTELSSAWYDHKISMLMIRDILMYMDRVYVTSFNVPTVYDLGLARFRENIARFPKIKDRLLKIILSMIYKERTGEVINRSLLKSTTQMLVDLGVNTRQVYEEDFERHFLESSAYFYRMESQEFISSNSCSDYLNKVEARLREELNRVAHYLDPSTEPKIRETVEKELISAHMKTLVEMENSGCIAMLRDDKIEDLARMYTLFQRVPDGMNLMRQEISNYLLETGKKLVDEETLKEQPGSFILNLLTLKDKYNRILSQAFLNDKTFKHSFDKSFEQFINLNPKSPEYISLFIDEKLRVGLKGATEEEVEQILDKVMNLFRFIQEKDVFEKYYKQHLAKRLLLGKSLSDDAERNMIGKLKTECGYQFTSKLEGMFNDMRLSADTMEGYKTHLAQNPNEAQKMTGIDLNVQILTTGFWPTSVITNCNLPPEILSCCDVFKNYYLGNHSARRLTWQTNMGTAELKAYFGQKKHELNVSTYQMCILLHFNNAEEITFKDLLDMTAIPAPDLKRAILSLSVLGKYKILLKSPDDSKVNDSDVFAFNHKFRSKLYRIKVTNVSSKETEPERLETRQKVDEDRKHQIEAAIVRIMKSRRTMEHSNLISEVTKQLSSRFLPNPVIVKKRIESLIERDYLERSKVDRKIYQYLA
eukprot:TRINITY_DN765_c0_g1_i1.p1 TRINITY_DN765_c0_g1~~TRINITY_DN765_c0_g1_i1.p1  ORF type:complete len:756 (+),score=129.29 TRINITY_DN765_c0_g1_i1:106-2268(+)